MKNLLRLLPAIIFLFTTHLLSGQSPGLIVRPAGGNGVNALNPNGDGYSSLTTAGFLTDDILQSELGYKVVPAAITEPTGDLSTGPSGGFTDIVTRVDGSGFYLYKDATNIYFRLRIGGIISGSKGYSVLIDTDGKMGASGPAADPNYVAPSGSSPGNRRRRKQRMHKHNGWLHFGGHTFYYTHQYHYHQRANSKLYG